MTKYHLKIFTSIAALSLAFSCGQNSENGPSTSTPGPQRQLEEAPVDGSNIKGHYQATFITLNPHVNGTIPGSANFFRKEGEDRLYVYVRLFAGGVKAWHMQHVYTGGRCPTQNDDTNLDGFIDINEAEAVLGKILIPLDSNISSQEAGRRFFPLADASGYYHYERITSFARFLRDLQAEDKNPEDDLVKLAPNEGLRIAGKTVLIQGVVDTLDLPETVGTKGRFRATQTLPIVCGVFEPVTSAPGVPYVQDEIPGPIADVVEGQDRPAEDEIPSDETGGEDSGGSGSTNDADDGEGPVSDGESRTRGAPTRTPENEGSTSGDSETRRGPRRDNEGSTGTTGGSPDTESEESSSTPTTASTSSGDDGETENFLGF